MITPNTIHRFWSGPVTPIYYTKCRNRVSELHPDWEFRDWTWETIPEELRSKIEAGMTHIDTWQLARHISNIVRYWALYEQGGVWIDSDVLLHQPLTPLLGQQALFAGTKGKPEGALIISPPGHPVFKDLLATAIRPYPTITDSVAASGGTVLARIVPRHENIRILPDHTLNSPCNSTGPVQAHSVGQHLWTSSRLSYGRANHEVIDLEITNESRDLKLNRFSTNSAFQRTDQWERMWGVYLADQPIGFAALPSGDTNNIVFADMESYKPLEQIIKAQLVS